MTFVLSKIAPTAATRNNELGQFVLATPKTVEVHILSYLLERGFSAHRALNDRPVLCDHICMISVQRNADALWFENYSVFLDDIETLLARDGPMHVS